MFHARPEGYIGKQFAEGFTSYIIAGSYFGVISLEDGISQDEGKQLVETFKQGLLSADVTNLARFESVISNLILTLNFPAHIALAIGFQHNNVLYLKTVGEGQIFFRRSNTLSLLLSGDKSASGYIKEFDMAVFSTVKVATMIGTTEDIQVFVGLSSPKEIIEKIQSEEYGDEEQGFVSLFVEFSAKGTAKAPSILDEMEPKINDPMAAPDVGPQPTIKEVHAMVTPPQIGGTPVIDIMSSDEKPTFIEKLRTVVRNKVFITVVVLLLFGLLSWSVFFGYQRRQAEAQKKQIVAIQEELTKTLQEAEDEAYLNLDGALVKISDAKTKISQLKSEVGDSFSEEISALEKQITDSEAAILKRDEVASKEFYDLELEAEGAQGDVVHVQETEAAILDRKETKVYVLDLEKKSLDEYTSPDLTDAEVVALYNSEVYVFHKTKGVMKFASESKLNTIIEPDDEWGDIVDMELYSGNIYLLDAGNEEIYKYLVTEGGFSDKRPYLTSASDLSGATAMVIDSAIYVSTKNKLEKFISGAAESFSPQLPTPEATFDDIYTNPEIEQVYVLDKAHASVYILSKNGDYQRQLQSSVFGKGSGIYFFDDHVHVLSGSTIFEVSIK